MKKKLARIFFLTVCLLMILSVSAGAIVPYTTYTYNVSGVQQNSPHAYVPQQVISSASIKQGLANRVNEIASDKYGENFLDLQAIYDICVDDLGHVYIVDSGSASTAGSGRIICLDENYNLRLVINEFVNDQGVPDSFSEPKGVFVTDTEILVADSGKARIVIFDKVGNFKTIVPEPASDVFPEASVYTPVAVATDAAGRVYVVSSTTNYGVISLNRDGSFNGFIGPQKVTIDAWDYFWRMFQTAEQKKSNVQYVPTEYNNLTIDADGFLYVTTSSIDAAQQQAAIQSKSKADTYAPVKKLNPSGTDVMNRNGFFPPSGEVDVYNGTGNKDITISGASKIVDVALGPNGMWSIIDQKRSKVFTYDSNGVLLFVFGDIGDQVGNIQNLQAIAYQGSNILLLDSTNNTITVYKRTSYGDLIANALQNTEDQNYDAAVNYDTAILQRNNNYDSAYVGIGQSLYRDGEYMQAMQYFKYAYDTVNYSEAYSAYRKEWVEDYVILIPVIIVAICLLISWFFRHAKKVNKRGHAYKEKRSLGEELWYAIYVIFHPFDGFWDIKHEKRGSVKGATTILAITVAAFLYQSVGRGWLFNPYQNGASYIMVFMSVALPVALWVIANWCLTTLFDGEGTLKDVYIATCYALTPLPLFVIPMTIVSNFVTADEMSLVSMFLTLAYVWTGFLIFFGMMTVHDYTLGKNIAISLCTLLGAAIIMFIAMLFTGLIQKVFTFVYNIIVEIQFRM